MSNARYGRVALLVLSGFLCPIFAKDPRCVAPLSPEEYLRLSLKNRRKYELITQGPDQGRYKPILTERVTATGSCFGRYLSPCDHIGPETVLNNSNSCDVITSLVRNREAGTERALTEKELAEKSPEERARYVSITEGPDVCKYTRKYFRRVNFSRAYPKEAAAGVGPAPVGLYANPCSHYAGETVSVDSWYCAQLNNVVKKKKK